MISFSPDRRNEGGIFDTDDLSSQELVKPFEPIRLSPQVLKRIFQSRAFNKKIKEVYKHVVEKKAEANIVVYVARDGKGKLNISVQLDYGLPSITADSEKALLMAVGRSEAHVEFSITPPEEFEEFTDKYHPAQVVLLLHSHPSSVSCFSLEDLELLGSIVYDNNELGRSFVCYHPQVIDVLLTEAKMEQVEILAITAPLMPRDTQWQVEETDPKRQEEALRQAGFKLCRCRFSPGKRRFFPDGVISDLANTFGQ